MSKAEMDGKISRVSESVSQGGGPRVSIEGHEGGAGSGTWAGRGGLSGTGSILDSSAGWTLLFNVRAARGSADWIGASNYYRTIDRHIVHQGTFRPTRPYSVQCTVGGQRGGPWVVLRNREAARTPWRKLVGVPNRSEPSLPLDVRRSCRNPIAARVDVAHPSHSYGK